MKNNIMESLNQSDRKEQEDIKSQLLHKRSIDDVDNVLIDNGYSPIGEGSFRKVYSKDNINFVIKVAKSKTGIESNSKEIVAAHTNYRSLGVKKILPELYEFDHRHDPLWVICEKVIPIKLARFEDIVKVFPTFFSVLKKSYYYKSYPNHHDYLKSKLIDAIEDTYLNIVNNNITDEVKIVEEIFKNINLTSIKNRDKKENIDLQNIIKSERFLDIKHFINGTSYDHTRDLYLRNLGIRKSSNLSPSDFVILDFDTRFQRKNSNSNSYPEVNLPFEDFFSSDRLDNSENFSFDSHDLDYTNESVAEAIYKRLIIEASKQKRSKNRSHPGDSYEYGWPEFDDSWFDAEGITTWKEDREWAKQWYKRMGLMK